MSDTAGSQLLELSAPDLRGMHSLVCPAHNEEGNIARLLREWHAIFTQLDVAFELIVIDDGSTDGTANEVRRTQSELGSVRLLRRPTRGGQSRALATGLVHARGEILVTCDADLQNDPADLPGMLAKLKECDLVCGWRRDRRDSRLRRMVSHVANSCLQRQFDHQLHDVGCALRVFHRRVAEQVLVFDGLHRFFGLIALMAGFRVIEVPVHHRPRERGVSKYGQLDRLLRTLWDLVGLQWYRSRLIARAELRVAPEDAPVRTSPTSGIGPLPESNHVPLRKAG